MGYSCQPITGSQMSRARQFTRGRKHTTAGSIQDSGMLRAVRVLLTHLTQSEELYLGAKHHGTERTNMKYYQPRALEEDVFMLNFVGNYEAFEGAEALRRSSVDFWQFAKSRIRPEGQYGLKGGPWIIPLMRREFSRVDATEHQISNGRTTDIQVNSSVLLISERARNVIASLAPADTEILPVEVENSDDVFWVRPICVEDTLDVEKSYSSGGGLFERPVLVGEKLKSDHLFCYREGGNEPVFSETLVEAIRENDLYGQNFREVEVV